MEKALLFFLILPTDFSIHDLRGNKNTSLFLDSPSKKKKHLVELDKTSG
jgi:hypothetical protein